MFKAIALSIMLISLGACSTVGVLNQAGGGDFTEIALVDVQNAKILAVNSNDKLGLMCWTYLEDKVVENLSEAPTVKGEVKGVLSAYQLARNTRREVVEFQISDEFRINCGPMLVESAGALGRLGIRILSPLR